MTSLSLRQGDATSKPLGPQRSAPAGVWALALGAAALALPTLLSLSEQSWSQESGAHGPIILATGAWLLWREKPVFEAEGRPGNAAITGLGLIVGLLAYMAGRASDLITLDAGGLYFVGLTIAYATVGWRVMLRNWFPFLYFVFAVPPPAILLAKITLPLKGYVSQAATGLLSLIGLPVSHEGVTIYVAQYQLLVEDACSGMNSLIGLTAIGLLYVYLRRGSSLVHSLLLIAFIIPVAIVANIVRIITLILLTYFCGDETAQGILHPTAGLLLFAIALAMIFGVDGLLSKVLPRRAVQP